MTQAQALPFDVDSDVKEKYNTCGFVVVRGALPPEHIDELLEKFLEVTKTITGTHFSNPHSGEIVEFFSNNLDIESQCYTEIRRFDYLETFSRHPGITVPVRAILGDRIDLLRKVVYRIDLPRFVEEFAHWHQDHFYVKGDTNTVTAWVPLQDTDYLKGCISVMPGSHKLGLLRHEIKFGKRDIPKGIFDREIRYVEVEKGDIVLFHSLLLHSSNLNFSDSIRYSVQARYTCTGAPIDVGMLGGITLEPTVSNI
jgi:ectoine hydroxylase-related dioxygenase (phytanoyl-CoA dioxygenase family)